MDGDDKFTIAMMIIVCATVIGLTGLLVSCGNDINSTMEADERTAQDVSPAIEHANGCPLDAVTYDAPAFADNGSRSFKVVDRTSGAQWWLVKMGGEWVVLPIESKEAVDVG
jgi:hypothetical protein